MKKHNANEFESGDEVYHTTNPRLLMAITGINIDSNEVTCQWVDNTGKSNKETFSATVIKKWADKFSGITVSPPRRRSDFW
ncbi:MAG: hypothetical protein NVSMB24_02330 [Mucilaginibacter sp.]